MTINEATEQAYKKGYEDGKPKWIPVTERLPENMEDVLCLTKAKTIRVLSYDYIFEDWDIVGQPNKCFAKAFVTHWMPLPEPPKGE